MATVLRQSSIQHAEYANFKSRWKLIRDVLAGKKDIDDEGETYLPKPSGYSDDRYTAYQIRAVLYNATARTLDGYLGAIFRKEAEVQLPEELKYLLTDADGQGNNLVQFSKQVTRDVISMGRHGILVDYPAAQNIETLADERAANLQAHLVSYTPESITNWNTERVGSKTILTNLMLEETNQNTDTHVFEKDEYKRWRMLELDSEGRYVQRVMELKTSKDATGKDIETLMEVETIYPKLPNGEYLDYIPFVFVGSETFTPSPDLPPLYDLAQLNIAHYRNSADWEQSVFMVGQPTPWISGLDDKFIEENKGQLVIGSGAAWLLPDGAVAGMLESKSDRNMIQKAMEAKEAEMIGLGARIIQDNTARGSESTESVQLRRSGEASQLSCIADNVSQAMVQIMQWAGEWMNAGSTEIKYQLNKDFFAAKLTHQEMTALVTSWHMQAIPHSVVLDNFRRGEIISELQTNEEVISLLEKEGPPLGLMGNENEEEEIDVGEPNE